MTAKRKSFLRRLRIRTQQKITRRRKLAEQHAARLFSDLDPGYCRECDRTFKGARGLSSHASRAHGGSGVTVANRAARRATAAIASGNGEDIAEALAASGYEPLGSTTDGPESRYADAR